MAAFAVLLLGTIGAVVASHIYENRAREEALKRTAVVADEMATRLAAEMAARGAEIRQLAKERIFTKAYSARAKGEKSRDFRGPMREELEDLQRRVPMHSWIALVDLNGRVAVSTQRILEGMDVSAQPYFNQGRSVQGAPWFGNVHRARGVEQFLPKVGKDSDQEFVDISMSLVVGGRSAAVFVSQLNWAWAEKARKAVVGKHPSRKNVQLFITDAKGNVLLDPPTSKGAKPLTKAPVGKKGSVDWGDGVRAITGHAAVPERQDFTGAGWTVMARIPESTVYAFAHSLRLKILIASTVLALLVAVTTWFVLKRRMDEDEDEVFDEDLFEFPRLTKRKKEEERIEEELLSELIAQQAVQEPDEEVDEDIDETTGVRTEHALLDLAARAQQRLAGNPAEFAVLYSSLNGFSAINSTYGHDAGDLVLRTVAERIQKLIPDDADVFRVGGDEFAVLLLAQPDKGLALGDRVAARIESAVRQPIAIAPMVTARVGISVGLALWDSADTAWDEVFEEAKSAMYLVKNAGAPLGVNA
ncbi:MAG TPA: diguanylate cyclase [Burkholderiaceae bacterium]|nr:diguanylate cyclase [Burkholderiaceae bacterium]